MRRGQWCGQAIGGSINLVTRTPAERFEAEGRLWTGGHTSAEGVSYFGSMQLKFAASSMLP